MDLAPLESPFLSTVQLLAVGLPEGDQEEAARASPLRLNTVTLQIPSFQLSCAIKRANKRGKRKD